MEALTEPEVLTLLGSIVGLVGGVLAIWWKLDGRIKAGETAVALRAEAAVGLAQHLAVQLSEYKLHVAETYITKTGMREQTEQIMGAIGDLKGAVSGFNVRMDRIIENQLPKN